MICAFTGHRPEKLPWGGDESDPRCAALKILLRQRVAALAGEGSAVFLCGMARGCDFYFAEAVLALARECPGVALEAWIPCPSQDSRWPRQDRLRRGALLEGCSAVRMVEPGYSSGCMLRRNRAMVDAAEGILTVWDGTPGGTAATVRYALEKGKWVESLWR